MKFSSSLKSALTLAGALFVAASAIAKDVELLNVYTIPPANSTWNITRPSPSTGKKRPAKP